MSMSGRWYIFYQLILSAAVVSSQTVQLNISLDDSAGNIVCPKESVVFDCKTENSLSLEWISNEYIGTNNIEFSSLDSEGAVKQRRITNIPAFGQLTNMSASVFTSQFRLVVDPGIHSATVMCRADNPTVNESISFTIAGPLFPPKMIEPSELGQTDCVIRYRAQWMDDQTNVDHYDIMLNDVKTVRVDKNTTSVIVEVEPGDHNITVTAVNRCDQSHSDVHIAARLSISLPGPLRVSLFASIALWFTALISFVVSNCLKLRSKIPRSDSRVHNINIEMMHDAGSDSKTKTQSIETKQETAEPVATKHTSSEANKEHISSEGRPTWWCNAIWWFVVVSCYVVVVMFLAVVIILVLIVPILGGIANNQQSCKLITTRNDLVSVALLLSVGAVVGEVIRLAVLFMISCGNCKSWIKSLKIT